MFSTKVIVLQLLLVSLTSASHFYGSVVTFTAKKNSNGNYGVEIRNRATYRGCGYNYGPCYSGNCGINNKIEAGLIDSSPNAPSYPGWCESETVITKTLTSNRPFQMREDSCCWVFLNIGYTPSWSVLTSVDLGRRSDTNAPNNSPDVAILPFLRVPQNCRRTYNPVSFDPDGDKVRCRYGIAQQAECYECRQHYGFQVDQATCTLQYLATAQQGAYGFELVVEDFPRNNVNLYYSDGSSSRRYAVNARRKRTLSNTSPLGNTTAYPNTTTVPTTTTTTTTTTPQWWMPTTTPNTPSSWGTPFSQLPMQFTLQVDPPAPSCIEGDYLPRFVPPTPRNGEVLLAQAGREVEIKVKAEAQYSVLDNIIMSGPLNITKHRTTGDEFIIRWTPINENLGNYFPICFAVEFTNGSAIYQTAMRCVVVNVTARLVKTTVTCLESSMIVEVEKATLPQIHYEHLQLSDPSNTVCSLQTHSNNTHVVAIVPLNSCGTQIEEDEDDLFFKNEFTTVDNASQVITRNHQVEIKFFCQYSKRGNVTFTFLAHRQKVTVWDKGFGQFTYGFEFYPDQQFLTMIDPRLYPLEYDVGDRIYMEIEATTTVTNTELFVESCRATPYDTANYPNTYSLIENGCNLDSTIIVYPTTNKREFKFSLEAFKFIGLHDQVYISCSVLMCEAGNPLTRCSKGCQPNGPRRAKRETEAEAKIIQSGTHFVSQGPLRMRRSVEAAGNTGLNLNLNLVFITGCALAAVGMICGLIFYKTKRSSVKYRPLPLDES